MVRFFGGGLLIWLLAAQAYAVETDRATELNNRAVGEAKAGRFEEAAASLREALSIDPADAPARKNLSLILTDWVRQESAQLSSEQVNAFLEEAVSLDSHNGPAWAQLGELCYFTRNDLSAAVAAWQKAQAEAPPDIARALADRITRAQRDLLIERSYAAIRTDHFDIRFQDGRNLDTAALGGLLESAYTQLSGELAGWAPRLAVIVYTDNDIRRVATQRDWAVGFYDGRIRLRVDELTAPFLSDMVIHELSHAFLQHLYGWRLPVWVHEGYAQLHESGKTRTPEIIRLSQQVAARTAWIPLRWLDRHFQQPTGKDDLLRAYAQSRLVVAKLVEKNGMESLRQFLGALKQAGSVEAAFDRFFAPLQWAKADKGLFD